MKTLLTVLMLIVFCAGPAHAADVRVKVVASIYPLSDITKQIGKEKVIVKTLLPPAASPHTFDPTPRQMMELRDAKLFIKVGAGLEFWAERIVNAVSNKDLVVVDLSKGMPLIQGVHEHGHEHVFGHKDKQAGVVADPHFWLDPVLAKKIADRIADALAQADRANEKFYRVNAKKYKQELDDLDREIKRKVSGFRTKEYVTFHAAWGYFSRRYGLRVIGVIEEAPGREPSPGRIAQLVRELKRLHARVVFAEPQFNPGIAEAIAKEAGAKVLLLDPMGAQNDRDKDTYIKIMRYNLSQMERAMQ